eukprot:NODE_881_length_1848_cov_28.678155_g782_i0.p1 GENE.NODE_881_length_1848_cov_28.678155_g782_i0~~NODE_881_length_1848_cov_28.678155_g782_i0.p1  ORF type:complete len:460 (+),score=78.81 NODE_881_length_1848_cov_28.678155_g782_i0:34-1380(+)
MNSMDVAIWRTTLPLAESGASWQVVPCTSGQPRIEDDYLCVLHDGCVWILPVDSPRSFHVFNISKSRWSRKELAEPRQLGKVDRACSFGSMGIYFVADSAHGIFHDVTRTVSFFDTLPNAVVDDCFLIGNEIYGGDNGTLYRFSDKGAWIKILEAPAATFWAAKGPVVYCFIKAKEHGKPLQIAFSYNTVTKSKELLDCGYVMPGELPFPYEVPSPIISHGPYFYVFMEDVQCVYAFDVFTFFPYQPLHRQWWQFVNSPKFSDISFCVNGQIFYGHKVLLSCYEYFAKLIDFPCQVPESGSSQSVQVTDITPEAFHQLLFFLYCGQINSVPLEVALELLFAGSKYLLPALVHQCCEKLMRALPSLALRDTIVVLHAAYSVDETGPLFKKALATILERHPDFMAKMEFIQVANEHLEFYKKVVRIAMQFLTVDKTKLLVKSRSCLCLHE